MKLVGFATLMLLAGFGLSATGGPPRAPADVPRLDNLLSILTGSTLPIQPLALALLDLAWLVWLWILASLGVELLVEAAEALAYGATWVRSLRRLADRLTFPLARRAVAAAFAVQILTRGVPLASAQTISPAEVVYIAGAEQQSDRSSIASTGETPVQPSRDGATYVVHAGDTLWSIADQMYGTGTAYRRLLEANVGRRMPDGLSFGASGVIQPGWELVVPAPDSDVEVVDGRRWYTVRAGDTLRRVGAVVLGDEGAWREVFELNRGAASPDGGHVLSNPDVIWPGLRLQLPPPPAPSTIEVHEPAPMDLVAASRLTAAPVQAVGVPSRPPSTESRPVLPRYEYDSPPPLTRTAHPSELTAADPSDVPPVVAEPVSTPTETAPPPPADTSAAAQTTPDGGWSLPDATAYAGLPLVPFAVGGVGIAALAGTALGVRRVRRLRRLPVEAESEVVVEGGFAEARVAHDFTRRLHGVGFDPLAGVVGQLRRFLDEYNLGAVGVVAARHGRSATTLTLSAALAEQPILIDLAPVFATRLEAEAESWVTADQDVCLRLVRLRKTHLLPATEGLTEDVCLVPLGVLYDRQEYVVTCSSLGHVLVVSQPGHGADTILTSLLATLTARRSPDRLAVWLIGHPRALPAPLYDLPHLVRSVDPADEAAMAQATRDLRTELDARAVQAPRSPHTAGADLVVVVPELTSLGEHAASFELLASRAAHLGVRFVAASGCAEEVRHSPLIGHFGTRMVLRMQDEETSVALLGVADAAFIGGGGRLLLRLDGREPVELYGYQVAGDHLERLVRVMRSAYPSVRDRPTVPPASYGPADAPASEPTAGAAEIVTPPARVSVSPRRPEPEPVTPLIAEAADFPTPEILAPPMAEYVAPPTPEISVASKRDAAAPPASEPSAPSTPAAPARPGPRASAPPSPPADVPPPAAVRVLVAGAERAANAAGAESPPLEIVCFGRPRVLCAGRQVWPRRGGDAKPWEFLLYVACQPAEGVSSDEAVEALWPGEEEALDAPHRFRQLRYRLRHALATVAGAPPTDGICLERGTLRLDPRVVRSDAQEFLAVVRTARLSPGRDSIELLERARELYAGDLLEGPDARRYAWLDERDDSGVTLREHFRRLFQHASARLAELYAVDGDLEEAIDLYRELTDIDPGDERVWRALFRLHAQRGDRLALIREEHRMREALHGLAAEIEADASAEIEDPSRETAQEYQRLLASLHDHEREAAAV